ncbi:MAG: hypothetical protein QOF94_240 [Acidobacteriaceae bacterium]
MISREDLRRFVSRMRHRLALAAALFITLLGSTAEGQSDLCELPIEVLMQLEFIPATRLETPARSDGAETLGGEATSVSQMLLVPGMQLRSLVLPDIWSFCLPCFRVVVLDGSSYEGGITNKFPDVYEHMIVK